MVKPGDLVQHTASFLRSAGWYTNVPRDGKVLEVDGDFATVHWHDREEPSRIRLSNIKPKNKWEPN